MLAGVVILSVLGAENARANNPTINIGTIAIYGPPDAYACGIHYNPDWTVDVGDSGGIVTVQVNFEMYCPGAADDGYCDIGFVDGSDSDSVHTGEELYGILQISKYCLPGETIQVKLHYKYTDWWGFTLVCEDSVISNGVTRPGRPLNFNAESSGPTSIDLSWTKGNGAVNTIIRRDTGGYPSSPNSGTPVYSGTGTSTTDSGLSTGVTYYYSAWSYANGEYSSGYSTAYATTQAQPPDVETRSATNIQPYSAQLNGRILNDGGASCQVRFRYREVGSGTWIYPSGWHGSYSTGDSFSETVTSLSVVTTYEFQVGAKNYAGEDWGNTLQFTTPPDIPSVQTNSATNVGHTSANLNGRILNDNGAICQVRFRYRQQGSGTWVYPSGWHGSYSTGDSFSETIGGLIAGMTYEFQAGAKNSAGEKWGSAKQFTTPKGNFNIIWNYPPSGSPFQVLMHRTYTIVLSVKNIEGYPQVFTYGLDHTPTPLDPWGNVVQNPENWYKEMSTLKLDGQAWAYGHQKSEILGPGETKTHTFSVTYKWTWMKPWDASHIIWFALRYSGIIDVAQASIKGLRFMYALQSCINVFSTIPRICLLYTSPSPRD